MLALLKSKREALLVEYGDMSSMAADFADVAEGRMTVNQARLNIKMREQYNHRLMVYACIIADLSLGAISEGEAIKRFIESV
jgi:hypothetical protein